MSSTRLNAASLRSWNGQALFQGGVVTAACRAGRRWLSARRRWLIRQDGTLSRAKTPGQILLLRAAQRQSVWAVTGFRKA